MMKATTNTTIYDITNIDLTVDPKYDSISNPKLLAKIALIYGALAACDNTEMIELLKKARRAICKEINRLLSTTPQFIRTSYFQELSRLLSLFIKLSNAV